MKREVAFCSPALAIMMFFKVADFTLDLKQNEGFLLGCDAFKFVFSLLVAEKTEGKQKTGSILRCDLALAVTFSFGKWWKDTKHFGF